MEYDDRTPYSAEAKSVPLILEYSAQLLAFTCFLGVIESDFRTWWEQPSKGKRKLGGHSAVAEKIKPPSNHQISLIQHDPRW
jgi:hypothetical protein